MGHQPPRRRPDDADALRRRRAFASVPRPRARAHGPHHRRGRRERDRGRAPLRGRARDRGGAESGHVLPADDPLRRLQRPPGGEPARHAPKRRGAVVPEGEPPALRPDLVRRARQLRGDERRDLGRLRPLRELPLHGRDDRRQPRAPDAQRRGVRPVRRGRLRAPAEPHGALRRHRARGLPAARDGGLRAPRAARHLTRLLLQFLDDPAEAHTVQRGGGRALPRPHRPREGVDRTACRDPARRRHPGRARNRPRHRPARALGARLPLQHRSRDRRFTLLLALRALPGRRQGAVRDGRREPRGRARRAPAAAPPRGRNGVRRGVSAGAAARGPGSLERDPPQGRGGGLLRRARQRVHVPRGQLDPASHALSRLPDLLADRHAVRPPPHDGLRQPRERALRGPTEPRADQARGGPRRPRPLLRAGPHAPPRRRRRLAACLARRRRRLAAGPARPLPRGVHADRAPHGGRGDRARRGVRRLELGRERLLLRGELGRGDHPLDDDRLRPRDAERARRLPRRDRRPRADPRARHRVTVAGAPDRHPKDRLARGLSLNDATMLVVSSVIGSGIFLTPGAVAGLLPHPGLILAAWVAGGLLSLAGALANAELGAMYPHAGGDYVYLREAYHPAAGFLVGWLTYLGWNAPVYVASEIRRPDRNLPLSLFLGLGVCTAVYLAGNAVYLYAIPFDRLRATSNAGEAAAAALFGPVAGGTVAAFVLVSILGTLDAMILVGPRIAYAMALDGLFFADADRVHGRYRTPHRAIVVQGAVAVMLLGVLRRFPSVLDYTTFAIVLATMADTTALYALRRRRPTLPRPYRAWGYPIVPGLYLLANAAIAAAMLRGRPAECAVGLAVAAAGVPFYWVFARTRR